VLRCKPVEGGALVSVRLTAPRVFAARVKTNICIYLPPTAKRVKRCSSTGHISSAVHPAPAGIAAGAEEFEPAGAATPYPGVSSAVRCAVNFYGITNLATWRNVGADGRPKAAHNLSATYLKIFGAESDEAAVLRSASPVTHLTRASVPLLTLHGTADTTVDPPQAEELDRVARERGARHQLVLLDGAGHTFDLQKWGKKTLPRDLRPEFLAFLAQHLK
jgi:pimeloyl-ACP methyl ester carboxylesterase